ncbi:MAG: shikimate kinase [Candidatus Margulisiibacteriota bacterium]
MVNHLVIIGFMGVGKSVVGAYVSKELGMPFIDLDLKIAASFGDISSLFKQHGETYFREREYQLLRDTVHHSDPYILSTGGGILTHEPSYDVLKKCPHLIWLKASYETVLNRIRDDIGNVRPLADDGMETRFIQRQPLYASIATETIDVDDLMIEEVAQKIINRYR